jgi:hypothetical protein
VMMPDKFALEFDEFDRDIVDLPDHLGTPVVREQLEFLGDIDFVRR